MATLDEHLEEQAVLIRGFMPKPEKMRVAMAWLFFLGGLILVTASNPPLWAWGLAMLGAGLVYGD
jgi:hypothetical protein